MKRDDEDRARSPARGRADERHSLAEIARDAAEDLLGLVTAQIKLARLEVSTDLRAAMRNGLRIALFVPPVIVGYGFGMAAIASWLSDHWGRTAALASVGGFQIVAGGAGALWSVSALRRASIFQRAGADMAGEVQKTIAAVSESVRTGG